VKRLWCIGVVVADLVAGPIDGLPPRGGLACIERMAWSIGGNAANAAVAYARLGGPAECVGCIGNDPGGSFLEDSLRAEGVGVDYLGRSNDISTASTIVLIDPEGERCFLHRSGGNSALDPRQVQRLPVAHGDLVLIAGVPLIAQFRSVALVHALELLKARGATVVVDTVGHPTAADWTAIAPSLPWVDWFVPSESEALGLAATTDIDRAMDVFLDAGAKCVAIKCGRRGSRWGIAGIARETIPGYSVDVVDTLGAGDAWCAGLIAGIGAGLRPRDALRCANRVGADSVRGAGASAGLSAFADVLARIELLPS